MMETTRRSAITERNAPIDQVRKRLTGLLKDASGLVKSAEDLLPDKRNKIARLHYVLINLGGGMAEHYLSAGTTSATARPINESVPLPIEAQAIIQHGQLVPIARTDPLLITRYEDGVILRMPDLKAVLKQNESSVAKLGRRLTGSPPPLEMIYQSGYYDPIEVPPYSLTETNYADDLWREKFYAKGAVRKINRSFGHGATGVVAGFANVGVYDINDLIKNTQTYLSSFHNRSIPMGPANAVLMDNSVKGIEQVLGLARQVIHPPKYRKR